MAKNPVDYFSPEAREARRNARLRKMSSIEVNNPFADRYAASRLTTQNAGIMAVSMARDILSNYRIPTQPKLSYSGLRNGRTAANSSQLTDGVITVHANFKTISGINVDVDIPIEIRAGQLQDPSVIVHNGAPRIMAQSTFNDIVTDRTTYNPVPVREMYSQPLDKNQADRLYKDRYKLPYTSNGMFSVSPNRIRAAIRGVSTKEAQQVSPSFQPRPQLKKPHPGQMFPDSNETATKPNQDNTGVVQPQAPTKNIRPQPIVPPPAVSQTYVAPKANVPQRLTQMSTELNQLAQELQQSKAAATTVKGPKMPKQPKAQNPAKIPALKPPKIPKPKAPPDTKALCAKCNHAPCVCPNKRKKKKGELVGLDAPVYKSASKIAQIYDEDDVTLCPYCDGDMHMCQCASDIEADNDADLIESLKFLREYGDLFDPGEMNEFDEGIIQRPSDDVPRKREFMSSDMLAKITAEVEDMRTSGLSDVDIKQAVFKKYGPDMAAQIFKQAGRKPSLDDYDTFDLNEPHFEKVKLPSRLLDVPPIVDTTPTVNAIPPIIRKKTKSACPRCGSTDDQVDGQCPECSVV